MSSKSERFTVAALGGLVALVALTGIGYAKYKHEKITGNYSTIGAEFYECTRSMRKILADTTAKGVIIVKVYQDTPAAEMGLEDGDIITTINGYKPGIYNDVVYDIEHTAVGEPVVLTVKHRDMEKKLSIPVVPATSVTNPDFQSYYATRMQYGILTSNIYYDRFNTSHVAIWSNDVYKLLKDVESKARYRGNLLLAEKYASVAKSFKR